MSTETLSKYATEKNDREARKYQKQVALKKLDGIFEFDNIADLFKKHVLSRNIDSINNDFCVEEKISGGVIISKDTVSQLLIRRGYKRWWKREKQGKGGLMYFHASDGIQLPSCLIKVNKDVEKNSFLFTVFPATKIVKDVEWALAMEIYMEK